MPYKRIDGNILDAFIMRNNQGSNVKSITSQINSNTDNITINNNTINSLQSGKQDVITSSTNLNLNNLTSNNYISINSDRNADNSQLIMTNSVNNTTLKITAGYKGNTRTANYATYEMPNIATHYFWDNIEISNNLTFSGSINNISSTIFSYLSGTSSNIQTQINNEITARTNGDTNLQNQINTINNTLTPLTYNSSTKSTYLANNTQGDIYIGNPADTNNTAQNIYIGSASDKVYITGELINVNTTNTNVLDSIITLNKGGVSYVGSGFEIENNGSIVSYFKLNSSGKLVIKNVGDANEYDITTFQPLINSSTNIILNNLTFNGVLNNISPTTFGYLDATSSIQTQLNGKQPTITSSTDITLNNLTFNGLLNTISPTTFGYLSGTTSNIQTQINNKQDLITSSTNLTLNNLTFNGTLNNINSTTFGYLSGTTSNIQTQINNKQDTITSSTNITMNKLSLGGTTDTNYVLSLKDNNATHFSVNFDGSGKPSGYNMGFILNARSDRNPYIDFKYGGVMGNNIAYDTPNSRFLIGEFSSKILVNRLGNDTWIGGKLKINSNNTSSLPSQALDVNGNILCSGELYINNTNSKFYYDGAFNMKDNLIIALNAPNIYFNTTNSCHYNSTGFGINKTNPNQALDVSGNIITRNGNQGFDFISSNSNYNFIDVNCQNSQRIDYDVRIDFSGGSNNTGEGSMTITASNLTTSSNFTCNGNIINTGLTNSLNSKLDISTYNNNNKTYPDVKYVYYIQQANNFTSGEGWFGTGGISKVNFANKMIVRPTTIGFTSELSYYINNSTFYPVGRYSIEFGIGLNTDNCDYNIIIQTIDSVNNLTTNINNNISGYGTITSTFLVKYYFNIESVSKKIFFRLVAYDKNASSTNYVLRLSDYVRLVQEA